MSNLRVARVSSHKVKQTCIETNENCKCTPRSSGSYPGLETSGNCMYTLGFKELCFIMVAGFTADGLQTTPKRYSPTWKTEH